MERVTSSARRRHLHTPASPRSIQAARWDTGPEEDLSVALKGRIPGISGEVNLKRRGSDRSPTAKAVTMLILVTAAGLAAIIIAIVSKFAGAAALLVTVMALAAFASVLITGTIISFRQGVAPGHLTLGRVNHHCGDGTDADDGHDQADIYPLAKFGGRTRLRRTRGRSADPGGGQLPA